MASVLVQVHPAASRETPVLNCLMPRKEMCHLKSQQVESRDSGLMCLEIGFPSVPLGVNSILGLELGRLLSAQASRPNTVMPSGGRRAASVRDRKRF